MSSKISFVVPVYNKQSYIAECLESLINQTMKDIEIIVVDDGSKDDSIDLVKHYVNKDKRVKLYCLNKNMGRSYARNYGNKKANSEIICVQDADDFSVENRAELVYKAFKKDKKASIFYSGFYICDELGSIKQWIRAVSFNIERAKQDKTNYICHSTMAYKKKDVPKYAYGDYCKLGLDDWKLQLDAYKKNLRFIYIDKPLVVYRNIPNSTVEVRNKANVVSLKNRYLLTL